MRGIGPKGHNSYVHIRYEDFKVILLATIAATTTSRHRGECS